MPALTDDDVLDFMVTEAVVLRVEQEAAEAERKAAKDREKAAWKANTAKDLPG